MDTYMQQIFKDGFFQADPHPGNLFVIPQKRNGVKLAMVDFGLCKELSKDTPNSTAKTNW